MELQARILQHASALFMRNGIKSVSMDDIATDLAMSKKTLYKAFANKDELVTATMTNHMSRVQSECLRVQAPAHNAVEQLLDLTAWADEQFAHVHPSIFYDLRKYHPAAWGAFQHHKNTFILNQITENLRRGVAEGLFRADLDVEVLARLSLAQIDLTFDPELYPPTQFAPLRVNRVLDDHFLRGVVTLAGYELIERYHRSPATQP
ncbi:MAG: TetR/AcrR family transcriptional regulator [Janthinobacterium lividum]